MSELVYISFRASEGVLKSLGMKIIALEKNQDLPLLLRQLKQQNVSIVFVSEAVYEANIDTILKYDNEFSMSISILPNTVDAIAQRTAQKRLNHMISEVVGVQIKDKGD